MQQFHEINTKNNVLNIVQISDLHLFSEKKKELRHYNTYTAFLKIIEVLKTEKPDFLLLTGDISEDGTPKSYHHARHALAKLHYPIYWLAGNHDAPNEMQQHFVGPGLQQLQHLSMAGWDFIAVDTYLAGSNSGFISEQAMQGLLQQLDKVPEKHIVVLIMHHQPYPIGTPLVDSCMLQQHENFLTMLREYPVVKLILCGHVHGDYQITLNDHLTLESCPATCFQWEKGAAAIKTIDARGFKRFSFTAQNYQSSVVWV